ncbi:MAG: hypothetical protein MI741_09595, partial [Rhodospirillales bacterium]|nr:hypothetical protein [Rhodospirillales bacterium]
ASGAMRECVWSGSCIEQTGRTRAVHGGFADDGKAADLYKTKKSRDASGYVSSITIGNSS